MIKTNGQIKDLGPRNAVYWWIYCNGGRDNIRVYVKSQSTVFVNRYGDTLTFNHVLDFKDIKFYEERFVDTNEKELCGELQNDADM